MKPFLQSLEAEMLKESNFLPSKSLDTIYIGGGTPSLCSVGGLSELFDKMSKIWDFSSLQEITLEANPEDLTLDYLRDLKNLTPINRISMGVQSFSDDDLRFMNRRHTALRAEEAYADARKVGFDNISLDLIYGVPNQSTEQWTYNVERMLQLSPEHISAYHLSIEPKTRFGLLASRGEIKPVDEELSQLHYDILCASLEAEGYEHYEISNFAKPTYRAKHNSSYWTAEPYLGLGPGAHSFDGQTRRWCEQSVKEYIGGVKYEKEEISQIDSYNEFIMLSLRQNIGVDIAIMRQKYGQSWTNAFLNSVQKYIDQGFVSQCGNRIAIKPSLWLVSDTIMADLFIL